MRVSCGWLNGPACTSNGQSLTSSKSPRASTEVMFPLQHTLGPAVSVQQQSRHPGNIASDLVYIVHGTSPLAYCWQHQQLAVTKITSARAEPNNIEPLSANHAIPAHSDTATWQRAKDRRRVKCK
ncbi:hypothetical protein COEREDRAFT_8538 [Coemansia reversa NRRL 1564]|uniref:Uncharacterized protein n=1 Tax=Coemansia reversa (strain ATCC 12441 / NRRL 1564) TaxID=763665 RepID=A0A2G5BBM7_COERN|nr:hypothetical protein COEREDRAFT_8538 [Coemansia reversa NRRL 1564]|eukprot:PIA16419.1 hypothetical protein COEREDRAFT_8538 [Coemansia reversa NRRL 1564]